MISLFWKIWITTAIFCLLMCFAAALDDNDVHIWIAVGLAGGLVISALTKFLIFIWTH